MITDSNISEHLKAPVLVMVYDELTSTNLTAKELFADGASKPFLVVARRQRGGRGRMGRSFFSPDGGLYMSLLLPYEMEADMSLRITTAAAVAVSRAIDSFVGDRARIKWVNDVYLDGRKVCGILTEGGFTADGRLSHAVLGIGVNLVPPESGFPEDIKDRAGAVFERIENDCDCKLCAMIVNNFMELFDSGLDSSHYIDEYRRRSIVIGRRVDVMRVHDGEAVPADVLAINDDFGLCVRYGDGRCDTLSSGDVSLRL